jgi:hypothetical protein
MLGSVGPWVTALILTVNGLDAGNWGITALTLGAISCVALLTELFWPRTPFNPQWAVPVAWLAGVAGVACASYAVPGLIRIMTLPKANFFGIPVGAGVGWGLWLLVLSSAVLCVAASIVAMQIAKSFELLQPLGQSTKAWTNGWRWAAIVASAVIAISGILYFATHWEDNSGGSAPSPTGLPSFPSFPSFTGLPSFSSSPSSANISTTPRSEAPTSTSVVPTTTTTATSGAVLGLPCGNSDHDKLIYDPASGQEIACQEVFWPSYGWSWQKAPPTEGVHIQGTACDGQRAYSNSRTADGYLIECMPLTFTNNEIAGPGSVWSQPANQ